ncbi:beta-1,3-galactosyltransferase 5 isoform X1 [Cherax quadricarinatus]|uniref:beta-1,3-galactosyltransferase 5 isoform X1 n=2 Tax=Cherax quadricarinatus TaxID=27406 RepID=UPI002379C2C0|nr:beta-1,3-galactosyltransferase 5-like isoform X1 [Cherax quadricarinatus]
MTHLAMIIKRRRMKGLCLQPQCNYFKKLVVVLAAFITIFVAMHGGYLDLLHQRALNNSDITIYRSHVFTRGEASISPKTITSQNNSSVITFPFKYLINEPGLCVKESNLYIINTVSTAPWEVAARTHIRRLWANTAWQNITGFRTVFLTGEVNDRKVMADLKEESNKYHDIIQFGFLDTYDNLTFKILSMLHWVNTFCPTPAWVLKSDSDVLVNTFELSRFLKEYDKTTNESRNQFLCRKRQVPMPCRRACRNIKWRVSWREYPHKYYPVYCMGPGYIMPRRLIAPLYHAANKTHPFRMEDVYYTGIIPQKLKWQNTINNIANRFPWRPRVWKNSFIYSDLMILELDQGLGPEASNLVWTKILRMRELSFADNETMRIRNRKLYY